MQTITTIGLDIAKSVFQVHGVDAAGQVVIRRQGRGSEIGTFERIEIAHVVSLPACGSGQHEGTIVVNQH